jgi:hypothetical protein
MNLETTQLLISLAKDLQTQPNIYDPVSRKSCIVGLAVRRTYPNISDKQLYTQQYRMYNNKSNCLGLTSQEFVELFFMEKWPIQFQDFRRPYKGSLQHIQNLQRRTEIQNSIRELKSILANKAAKMILYFVKQLNVNS